MSDDMGNRTEAPTSKRLQEAREKGQIPKSTDLTGAVDLIGAAIVVYYYGHMLVTGLGELMQTILSGGGPIGTLEQEDYMKLFNWAVIRGLMCIWPLVVISCAIVLAGHLQQTGFQFSFKPLELKPEKLNPFTGFGKLFAKRNVVKTVINSFKTLILGVVVAVFIIKHMREMAALPMLPLMGAVAVVFELIVKMIIWLLSVMLVVGAADYVYQLWQHNQDMKMTVQAVKEDRKAAEGDIEMRARRLRMGRDVIVQRLKTAVPQADVVITNPTHFAVALKYNPATMAAPIVVAKGADYVAFRIRDMATAAGIPIIEKPPLARALYNNVPVGREVPNQFYEAVAEILAYVYRISGRAEHAQRQAAEAAGDPVEDATPGPNGSALVG